MRAQGPSERLSHEEVRRRLDHLADAVWQKRGGLALISGGPAAGKTSLLHEFGTRARSRGALLLTASACLEESALDWAVADQLFCGANLPETARQETASILSRQRVSPLAEALAVNELSAVLLDLAQRAPVVICVDDVHWSDSTSLQLITGLHRRLPAAAVAVVLTEWTRRWPAMLPFAADLARRPVDNLLLDRMTCDDVAAAVSAALDDRGLAHLAVEIYRLSGGNGRLVQAMIEDSTTPEVLAGAGTVEEHHAVIGQATRQAVLDCVHGWDRLLADVAHTVAVLRTPADTQLVSSMVGSTTDEVDDAMEILTEAGILVGGRYRHAEYRQAVIASLPTGQRRALHLRAAQLLPPRGATAIEVAPHLIAAGRAPHDTAVQLLRDAADQALAGDRLRLAVKCLDLARRDTPDGPVRTAITATLVRALWRFDPSAARQYLPDLHTGLARSPSAGWRDDVAAARAALWWGDHQNVIGLPGVQKIRDHPRAAVELYLSQLLIRGSTGDTPIAGLLAGSCDPWGSVLQQLADAAAVGVTEAAVVAAEQVLESCDLSDDAIGTIWWSLAVLVQGGRLIRATWWNEAFIAEAARRGSVTWGAVLTAARADLALRTGDAETAASCAAAAMDLLPRCAMGLLAWYPGATFVTASSRLRHHDEAERVLLALAEPDGGSPTLYQLRFLQARGHHLLATGRLGAALDQFEHVGRQAVSHQLDIPSVLPWRIDMAATQLALRRRRHAQETLISHLRVLSSAPDPRSRGQALRLLAATAKNPLHAANLLARAVRWLSQAGDRYELNLAHTDQRELERRSGLAFPEMTGRFRRLDRAGAPDPDEDAASGGSPNALSKSELRVASLAAEGRSNREIAAALFITVSTVEQHLTKVYRKLGVASRRELSALLLPTP
jgi:DNA-binding NarL/FixJ family response regulator